MRQSYARFRGERMEEEKVLLVAGTTKDYVNGKLRIGGSAYYALTALSHIDVETIVLTNSSFLRKICGKRGRHVIITSNPEFDIIYEITLPRESGQRDLRLRSEIKAFSDLISKVIDNGALDSVKSALISPVAQEITVDDVILIAKHVPHVIVDIQGLVRMFDPKGRVRIDHNLSREVIRKLRKEDIVIRGEISEFPPECRGPALVRCIEGGRARAVQTMGEGPIYVAYPDGRLCIANALDHAYGDDIGAGDVFSSIVALHLQGHDLKYAVATGTAASFLRIARSRIPWFSRKELYILSKKVLVWMRCLQ